jgi:hypothetical protein
MFLITSLTIVGARCVLESCCKEEKLSKSKSIEDETEKVVFTLPILHAGLIMLSRF